MKKTLSFVFVLAAITGLVLFASCAKRPSDEERFPTDEDPMDISPGERAEIEAELERQRRIAEEEIDEERRIREEAPDDPRREREEAALIDETVYFAFDDSSLTGEARATLLTMARWLRANGDITIIIEGHCDNRGTEEYNLALGSRRAESVKEFLVNAGVDSSRIVTISYGEERPAVRGENEEAWARNRRAEFRFQ